MAQAKIDVLIDIRSKLAGIEKTITGLKQTRAEAGRLSQTFKSGLGMGIGAALVSHLARLPGLIRSTAMEAIQLGSSLTDVSARLDIGVEPLQALQEASIRAGVGNEVLERALRNLKGRVQEAADGNQRYNESIERLGLSTAELAAMPLERRMVAFARAYENATDKSAAFRDIQNILGERAGPMLMEVLQRLSREGFDEVARSAQESGQVMAESVARDMDAAADAIEAFKRTATVSIGTLLSEAMGGEAGWEILTLRLLKAAAVFTAKIRDGLVFAGMTAWEVFKTPFEYAAKVLSAGLAAVLQEFKVDFYETINAGIELLNKLPGVEMETVDLTADYAVLKELN